MYLQTGMKRKYRIVVLLLILTQLVRSDWITEQVVLILQNHLYNYSFMDSLNPVQEFRLEGSQATILKISNRKGKLVFWGGNGWQAHGHFPLGKWQNETILADAAFTGETNHFSNLNDVVDFHIEQNMRISRFSFRIHGSRNRLPAFSFRTVQGITENNLFVDKYPDSEDQNFKRFFIDLLPEALGYSFSGKGRLSVNTFRIEPNLMQRKDLRIFLSLSYSETLLHLPLDYFNNTAGTPFYGERNMEADFNVNSTGFILGGIKSAESSIRSLWIGFSSPIFRFRLKPSNLPVQNGVILESRYLTDFPLNAPGFFSVLGIRRKSLSYSVSVAHRGIMGKSHLQTPVLVYNYPLTIVHRASLNVKGAYSSLTFYLMAIRENKIFSFRPEISTTMGWLKIRAKGDAELEYGLVSTPVKGVFRYQVYLVTLSLPVEYRFFRNSSLKYSYDRILPFIKRVDNNPLKLKQTGRARRVKKTQGGITHSLSLSILF